MSGTKSGSGVNVSADVAAIKTSTDDWLDDARLDRILDAILDAVGPSADHHEHIWPRSNGEGGAGVLYAITTNADDETNSAASEQDHWGEPVTFDPSETGTWELVGLYIEADTTNKTFQFQIFTLNPSLRSAKDGGNAWNEAAVVLTVEDGSLFETGDKVAVVSGYKAEIQKVASVAADEVTVVRETSQFGANNTGLRWNHSANDPGGEYMYRVGRSNLSLNHPMGGLYSASSSKDSGRLSFHGHRQIEGDGFVLIRALNQTDGTNGAHFHAALIYED